MLCAQGYTTLLVSAVYAIFQMEQRAKCAVRCCLEHSTFPVPTPSDSQVEHNSFVKPVGISVDTLPFGVCTVTHQVFIWLHCLSIRSNIRHSEQLLRLFVLLNFNPPAAILDTSSFVLLIGEQRHDTHFMAKKGIQWDDHWAEAALRILK